MRNAFVVLVSLCIELVSGFIVPSSVPEHSTVKNNISHTDTSRDVKVKSTTSAKYAELPKSRSNIDEIDLYEHATGKKNNQSERAYIYIKQNKNKNYFRSKLFKMCPIDRLAFPYTYESNKKNEVPKVKMQMPISQRVDERRDFFELLKIPILRPVNRKVNYNKIHKIGLPSLSTPSIPYSESFIKKYNLKNTYLPQAKEAAVALQNKIRKNYGYNGAFIGRPAYRNKKLTNRVEDANFEVDFINDDDHLRNFENNQEEDKLLDKFLKETLEDVSLLNVNDKVETNDCIQDCITKPRKKLPKNHGLLMKPICECGRNPSMKLVDSFISKDRSLREESDRNVTQSQSSEVINYEEELSDDSNMIKQQNQNQQDNDVIRPPNNTNQTSFL